MNLPKPKIYGGYTMKYLICVLTLSMLLVSSVAFAADYVVITNKSNPVTVVSAKEVKNIYLGKQRSWNDGSQVTVYTQTASPVNGAFLKKIVKKSPQQYSTFWKKSLFTGTGLPPKDFPDDAAMKKAVAAKAGAIGYISAASLDDSVKKLDIN
ncbi:MAG: phosphate ABC transporter substrate-binding protein [Desulfuromonas sp.]|nr:MAG: phosphate ABC transporter substrate-binding protein [Desulfuromonas sp.]